MLEEPTLRKAVELAVQTEQIGKKFYEELSQKFESEKEVHEIFTQLASDEKVHENQFKALLEKLTGDDKIAEKHQDYIKAASVSDFFQTDAFDNITKIDSAGQALNRAFNFEKTTLLYYEALRDVLGDSQELNQIIEAEKKHMTNLMKVIINDAKFRGLQDDWH
jgi:rubrerythrin